MKYKDKEYKLILNDDTCGCDSCELDRTSDDTACTLLDENGNNCVTATKDKSGILHHWEEVNVVER